VVSSDTAPSVDPVPTQTLAEQQPLSFFVSAQDPGDPLTFTAQGLPDGATLDSQTGEFRWTPRQGQAGNYTVNFTVTDGSLSASRENHHGC
jgi:hypothetical protein